MDELLSVAAGVGLGVVLISVLAAYPGEPFDYDANCGDACSSRTDTGTTSGFATNLHLSAEADKALARKTTASQQQKQKQRVAEVEHAAQRVKVAKLQELLGMEKHKVQELVEQAKQQAIKGDVTPGNSNSVSRRSYSAWLDRGFFSVVLGLLACVLWRDYSINVLSVAAYLFPREADTLAQVAAVPRRLLAELAAFWQ